jgi:glycosyltransferase involved in cell wall biosynthesis
VRLTICIPTVPTRRSLLSRLLHTLEHQLTPAVEVLIADGIAPMGDKLNECFTRARGEYVVCVDDDDLVADDFVRLATAGYVTDFIGYRVLVLENGRYTGTVRHSLDGDPKWSGLDRGVSPKCPVRTDIARQVPFGNDYHADRAWSQAVHDLCRSGAYINRDLYIYDHWNDHMVGTSPDDPRFRRPQRDIGAWPFTPEAFTWLA